MLKASISQTQWKDPGGKEFREAFEEWETRNH